MSAVGAIHVFWLPKVQVRTVVRMVAGVFGRCGIVCHGTIAVVLFADLT